MFQTGPLELLGSLGTVAKVVLLVLFLFSVISWVVILSKWLVFRSCEREDKQFLAAYARTPDHDEMRRQARHLSESPSAAVLVGIVERLQAEHSKQLEQPGNPGNPGNPGGGTEDPWPGVDRQYLERLVAYLVQGQISRLERYLPFLATTGNITPFIGLLGTVIGIIDAFQEIGRQGSASIAAVAPGVAEALVATAAGLFTAIPAVIAYNYYLTRIRRAAFRAETFSVEFLNALQARMRGVSR